VETGTFGLKDRPGRLRDAQVGDPFVAYVAGETVFGGTGRITGALYYGDSAIWEDAIYPHRVQIDLQLDLENAVDVRPMVNELSFITDKAHFPVFLRGGARHIPLSDFQLIDASIEQAKLVQRSGRRPLPRVDDVDTHGAIDALPELQSSSFHDRIAELIYLVGLHAGYQAHQRYRVHSDSPYQIDVVWLERGNPHVAVEVHDRGNLSEALDRLAHARDFNFRKVILVLVHRNDLARALSLLAFNEKLKHWIDIWSPQSVLSMYTHCSSFYTLFQRFEKSIYQEGPSTELA
jgi:hypothetical protein